jgi:hypothetical protein
MKPPRKSGSTNSTRARGERTEKRSRIFLVHRKQLTMQQM